MIDRDRRAELIAAAVSDELSASERAELESLRATDPTVDREIDELGRLSARVRALADWKDFGPPPTLRDRIIRSGSPDQSEARNLPASSASPAAAESAGRRDVSHTAGPRAGRAIALAAAAAACVLIGVGGTLVVQASGPTAPDGPPGTLGAIEEVDFGGEGEGVSVDGALVAHTWGTETILEIDGLPAGDSYSVVVLAQDGTGFDAGTFLGSDVSIDCRLNAAVLREDVAEVLIEDVTGSVVARAAVPEIS